MTEPPQGPAADQSAAGVPTCYRHPDRETWIRCQRCERPICPDCMRDAAVGFQCPDCVKQAAQGSRQNRALYGGERSADPRLTSYVIIGINALVWLAIAVTGGSRSRLVDLLALRPDGYCAPGDGYIYDQTHPACTSAVAREVPGVADGAWWQLITSVFTHVEIWHVALNMFAVFILGPTLEGIVGRSRFLAVYLVSGLASSAMVMWLSFEYGSTVGASGAIFGLLGALLVTARKARLNSQWLVQNLVLGVVITVVGWRMISWQGHLGGLLGGIAAAAIIAYAPKSHRSLVQWTGLGILAVALVAVSLARAASFT
ncbi:rhomboid family intramembrane serine protease [Nocardioides sp. zg-1228]|uniref:rhomboid family intramembrane serine protease n=1 Tax=Nocardioides sp. zg-1228 TaxID=2763008 RepID=UPI0016427EAB|nr:rhomboid family intramembrane serine protease [Nocardioides sp. zg-1228]MBC2932164.1 rhomboid family intramembrane serine protease [Nocardioides sp. zg-1228]QSF57702.1 rhomboid family intramembrane serine protease [Nocardioides sp. zg-1228]